jgi:hypothetical protein
MSFLKIRALSAMALAGILSVCVSAFAQPSLPPTIHEQEGPFVGVWSWTGQGYSATWNNGAAAILTVQSFTSASVIIERTDLRRSVSAGLTATYTGQISDAGNSIVNGRVTWTWPGHRGYPATGKWTATWTSPVKPKLLFGGQDVTNGTQTVVVGQQIALTVDPNGLTIKSQSWTVPGTRVKGYNASAREGKVDKLTDMSQSPLIFYWVDYARSRKVVLSYELSDGQAGAV